MSKATLGISLFLTGLCLLVFGPTVKYSFINYDDLEYVAENPYIERGLSFESVVWAFKPGDDWMPLSKLSHMAMAQFFGMRPAAHHAANVLLHLFNVWLVLAIVARSSGSPWKAAAVAALFCVHPVQAEAVSWVTARKDLLAGFFALGAIGCFSRSKKITPSVILLYALSLLAKPSLVGLPLVLFFLEKDSRKNSGPLLALSAAGAWMTLAVQIKAIPTHLETPAIARVLDSIIFYLKNIFYPFQLTIYGHVPEMPWVFWKTLLAAAFLGGVTLGLFRYRKKWPASYIGWMFFLLCLAPVTILEVPADRYLYIPILGVLVAGVWLLPKKVQWLLPAALSLALIPRTLAQSAVWADSQTLFTHALRINEKNVTAHVNLAETQWDLGSEVLALEHYRRAMELAPKKAEAITSLGAMAEKAGRFAEAEDYQRKALRVQPNNALAHFNLGNALKAQGKAQEAVDSFLEAARIKGDYYRAWFNAALALEDCQRLPEAIPCYQEALKIKPNFFNARNNLGLLWMSSDRPLEAAREFAIILKSNPHDESVRNNLAIALIRSGDAARAQKELELILKQNPKNPIASTNLKRLLQQSSKS